MSTGLSTKEQAMNLKVKIPHRNPLIFHVTFLYNKVCLTPFSLLGIVT